MVRTLKNVERRGEREALMIRQRMKNDRKKGRHEERNEGKRRKRRYDEKDQKGKEGRKEQ